MDKRKRWNQKSGLALKPLLERPELEREYVEAIEGQKVTVKRYSTNLRPSDRRRVRSTSKRITNEEVLRWFLI